MDLPAFSMQSFGASRAAKLVVYGALGVIGTAETIFYGKWAWAKLFPDSGRADSE